MRSSRSRPATTFVSAVLLMITPAVSFAECINKSYEMTLPDVAKRADGEHKLATLKTDHGLLEARAIVKGRKLRDIVFYHDGVALKEVRFQDLPKSSQSCANQGQKGAAEEPTKGVLSTALSWLVPPVEARYWCRGSGTITIKLVECWKGSDGKQRCSFRFIQDGKTCGWAICVGSGPS